jgi:hypothetical protein
MNAWMPGPHDELTDTRVRVASKLFFAGQESMLKVPFGTVLLSS